MISTWYVRPVDGGYCLDTKDARYPCLIGKNGLVPAPDKQEGDGATPMGCWPLRGLFYRPDRIALQDIKAIKSWPMRPLTPKDGWCDDAASDFYNYPVRLPFSGRHEKLWRADKLYDLILPLGYNDAPPKSGKGSAIFLHCRQPDTRHTQGCLALHPAHLLEALKKAHQPVQISIG